MAVQFILDTHKDRNGMVAIRVAISTEKTKEAKSVRVMTTTGLKITPHRWDKSKQRVKGGAVKPLEQSANTINAEIGKIFTHFSEFLSNNLKANLTKEDLDAEVKRFFGRNKTAEATPKVITFWDYFDKFTAERGAQNQWTKATFQKFAALKNHLKGFNPNLTFEDLTESGLNSLVKYMREKLQMRNSTIGKQLGFTKWFLRWASDKGHNSVNDFRSYSPKLKTTGKQVVFLEWDEVMRLFNYEIPANGTEVTLIDSEGKEYIKVVHDAAALAKTRDMFLFECFTSLRYSDVSNLKHSDIHGDEFTITTVKTSDTITIEINKFARAILDKYKDNPDRSGYVFPHLTNQRMNIYVKDLCELCGINQLITQTYYRGAERIDETLPKYELIGTHTGRRTFICNALMLGIPAEVVMKWTGHSDYKSMKPYVDVADKTKREKMDLFNQL